MSSNLMFGLKLTVGDWPDLNTNVLPQNERRAASQIQQSLHGLSTYANAFGAALRLFDESDNAYALATFTKVTNDGQARMYIAARDGAVTIYNFAKTLESIGGRAFTGCPTLARCVNHSQLRSARKLLRGMFPDFVSIRHSVTHAAELRGEAEHTIEGIIGDVLPTLRASTLGTVRTKMSIRGALQGRKFINTFEKRLRTYEISADTLAGLNAIKGEAFAAFAGCPSSYQQ